MIFDKLVRYEPYEERVSRSRRDLLGSLESRHLTRVAAAIHYLSWLLTDDGELNRKSSLGKPSECLIHS